MNKEQIENIMSKPTIETGSDEDQLLKVSLGPQHPSTHGVFRMNVVLDGETVVTLKPIFGYLHRNHEKIAENIPYLATMPYTDRLDYLCPLTNNLGYAMAVEELGGIEVPERAEYIRIITSELTRVMNHTVFMGFFLGDLGAWGSALMYAFRERENLFDLIEELTGARMMTNYMRFGGCRNDLPAGWIEKCKKFVDGYDVFLDEMEALIVGNEILLARTQNIGQLDKKLLINGGITGPMLRAAGVAHDVRKSDSYGIYDRFDFKIPYGEKGDCYDRMMIRFLEMRESLKILKQAIADIPEGDFCNPKVKSAKFKAKAGEAYARIEGPKGELGYYVISDGKPNPYRYHVRPPSFVNLTLIEDMCLGLDLADVVVILGSVDIVLGEVDR